jgi:hypothetical protein
MKPEAGSRETLGSSKVLPDKISRIVLEWSYAWGFLYINVEKIRHWAQRRMENESQLVYLPYFYLRLILRSTYKILAAYLSLSKFAPEWKMDYWFLSMFAAVRNCPRRDMESERGEIKLEKRDVRRSHSGGNVGSVWAPSITEWRRELISGFSETILYSFRSIFFGNIATTPNQRWIFPADSYSTSVRKDKPKRGHILVREYPQMR